MLSSMPVEGTPHLQQRCPEALSGDQLEILSAEASIS
jgi:hypothetical protein